jgi:hypothetical protein
LSPVPPEKQIHCYSGLYRGGGGKVNESYVGLVMRVNGIRKIIKKVLQGIVLLF